MNRTIAALGAGLALAIGATAAQAAVTVVSVKQNNLTGYNFTPTTVVDFNGLTAGQTANFTTGGTTFSSMPSTGGAYIEKGTLAYKYTAPTGDTTNYLALGNASVYQSKSELVTLAGPVSKLGFYWGSIDKYNTVTFLLNGAVVSTLSGTDVVNFSSTDGIAFATTGAGKGLNTNSSAYVSFATTGGTKFNEIKLTTTQPNFELDNFAIGGVPEASTWAMMLIGLGGLGAFMAYRRKTENQNVMLAA